MRLAGASVFVGRLVKSVGILGLPRSGKTTLFIVLRAFEEPGETADPERDRKTLEADLILNDMAILESRIEKLEKELRIGKKEGEREHELLRRCHERLESGEPMRALVLDAEELKILRGFQLLSRKPLLVVYNQDEH